MLRRVNCKQLATPVNWIIIKHKHRHSLHCCFKALFLRIDDKAVNRSPSKLIEHVFVVMGNKAEIPKYSTAGVYEIPKMCLNSTIALCATSRDSRSGVPKVFAWRAVLHFS